MYMLDLQSSRTPRSAACATEHHEPVVSGGEVALAKARHGPQSHRDGRIGTWSR
jgi:hypothetical protein